MDNQKKYLRGASDFGDHDVVKNDSKGYSVGETRSEVPSLVSISTSDNREDFEIHADNEVYDDGSDWTTTDLDIVVRELTVEKLADYTGAEMTEDDVMEEGIYDNAPEKALTFAGLRKDNGFRLFRYYSAKLIKYSVSLKTKGEDKNSQDYTLTFRCKGRSIDGKVRGTRDIADANGMDWLDAIPSLPDGTGE